MLNKNANCYNIEKNFKYSTVISTFSEHITRTIFRTLSIDIWQLKCQQPNDKQIKQKITNFVSANVSELSNFSSSYFWEKPLWNQKLLLPTAKSGGKTCSNVELFSIFFTNFFETSFRQQNKNNVVETISCFVYQLSKKYCVYYACEHFKYCSQINEYWLNNTACLDIVL